MCIRDRLSVCDDISSILRSTKKTAVLVTHDLSEAISIADRIIILTPRPLSLIHISLDAAELMSVGCNYLREHMIPEARIHYAYIDAGGTAPNVVQDLSLIHI